MYSYGTPGNITKKRVRVKRGSLNNMDLDSTYTYDTEGRNTAIQYPSTWNSGTSTWDAGPNLGTEFDNQGRLKKLKNLTTSADIISGTTYNAMGEMLTMTGVNGAQSETRTYNSIGQMTQLTNGSVNLKYNFHATQNNGKIVSEEVPSGEIVTYTYDSLNRLASATSSTPDWGQSFGYDGFGNLTTVSVTKGTAPSLSVSYSASTNRRSGDSADSNGNIFQNGITAYDVSNRVSAANITNGTVRYSYAPGNKRIWRGTWVSGSQTVDELTFYSAGGAKLCSYNLTTSGSDLRAAGTGYYEYFGGKLIKNAGGYITQDRLGSRGKYFPYGQDRSGVPSNGSEKFATYFRDSETGLDYAQNRYHSSGDGRFLTPDPLGASAARLNDPGSWNRYAYVGGDPVNRSDPPGLCWVDDLTGLMDHSSAFTVYGLAAQGFSWEQICWFGARASDLAYNLNNAGDISMMVSEMLSAGAIAMGEGGSAGSPRKQLETVVGRAIEILGRPECAQHFSSRGDPVAILLGFLNGAGGTIGFGAPTIAPDLFGEVFNGPQGPSITLNVDYYTDIETSAWTLIHELGHAFDYMFGPGGSDWVDDVDPVTGLPDANQTHNAKIDNDCKP